jgi:hypothetical protein
VIASRRRQAGAARGRIEEILDALGTPWAWNRTASLVIDMLVCLEEGTTWHHR